MFAGPKVIRYIIKKNNFVTKILAGAMRCFLTAAIKRSALVPSRRRRGTPYKKNLVARLFC